MPFLSDIPNKRAVWAWAIYDLANQSFQLLINTLLFSIYVASVIVPDPAQGTRVWSLFSAAGLLGVVILSPVLGALADQRSWKRELLLTTGFICATLTASLALLGPGDVALAGILYVTAAIACGLGENFLASFLPQLSTPRNVGRISAFGWTMSYVGALALLGITAAWTFLLDRSEPAQSRPVFIFAGLWFLAGILPTLLFLREKAVPGSPVPASSIVASAFMRLARTAREVPRFRHLARFFLAFFIYSMATLSMIYFLGKLGSDMGFGLPALMLFALVMTISAGAAAAIVSGFQDRLGHIRTIRVFLGVWIVGATLLALSQLLDAPRWTFWALSGVLGVGLGGIGTSSRAIVGAFTPEDRAAEFFGLWGMVYKLSGVCGVLLFGLLLRANPDPRIGRAIAVGTLAALFLAGFLLLGRVNEHEGIRAAAPDRS